jgi:hypothetical protein
MKEKTCPSHHPGGKNERERSHGATIIFMGMPFVTQSHNASAPQSSPFPNTATLKCLFGSVFNIQVIAELNFLPFECELNF